MIIADIQFPPLLLSHFLPDSGMLFPNFFFFVCLFVVDRLTPQLFSA